MGERYLWGAVRMFRVKKEAFAVIGKEGSTAEGEGFIQKLWQEANSHFEEVAPLAKRGPGGKLVGIWGAMTDFSRSFRPWEDGFCQGLYLAGGGVRRPGGAARRLDQVDHPRV